MDTQCGITHAHVVAWRLGRKHFGYQGDVPRPVGMLIGEAPGPHTDARLPLFPLPNASAAGRLLKYSDVEPIDYIGKLVRMNLCVEEWSERGAIAGVARALEFLLNPKNYHRGRPLRVLLLGRRVADAWNCGKAQFGYEARRSAYGFPGIQLVWIPHPSGRNLAYNDRRNQLRARRAVQWVLGGGRPWA